MFILIPPGNLVGTVVDTDESYNTLYFSKSQCKSRNEDMHHTLLFSKQTSEERNEHLRNNSLFERHRVLMRV